jgi:hypothetical protein
LPSLATLEDGVIDVFEHFWFDDTSRDFRNLSSSRPDIVEEDVLSVFIFTNGFFFKVNVASSSKSISNNERR